MRPDRRRLLEFHQKQLVEYIDIDVVLPYLQASAIIPDSVVESIGICTGMKARLELLKAIRARGDDAFTALFDALVYSKQENLANLLKPLIENNENLDEMACHSCPHTPRSLSEMRPRSISEREERGEYYHICHNSEYSSTFPRTRFVRDPTAWIDDNPMELTGLLDMPIEGTDGHSSKEQLDNWQKNSHNIYPNFSSPKGLCLVINNHKFSSMPQRNGTEVDCKNISKLYKDLGYKVFIHTDLTAKEMLNVFCDFAQCRNHGASLVVVVLTHGEKEVLIGVDGEYLKIDEVLSKFNSVNARHLTGKPKIFFFQACRGDRYDRGVAAIGTDHTDGFVYTDAFRFSPFACMTKPSKSQEGRLPVEVDFFIAYATVTDYVSWRNNVTGTWFIQAVVEVFSRHAHDLDISEMMTLVNRRIAHSRSTSNAHKQATEYSSRLRKKFFFFPGIAQP